MGVAHDGAAAPVRRSASRAGVTDAGPWAFADTSHRDGHASPDLTPAQWLNSSGRAALQCRSGRESQGGSSDYFNE